MTQDLISYYDIIKNTSVKGSVSPHDLAQHMDLEDIFYKSGLSIKFLEALLADRFDYTPITDYVETTNYAQDAFALFQKRVYKKLNGDDNNPTDLSCSADWEVQDIFTATCLNEVWGYIRNWLCWKIQPLRILISFVEIVFGITFATLDALKTIGIP